MKYFNRGIFVGMSSEFAKAMFGKMVLNARAEENPNPNPDSNNPNGGNPTPAPTINYEDLISKARAEEKAKQYKEIERLKTQIQTLTEQHNKDLLVVAELNEKSKALETKLTEAGKGDTEQVKTLKSEIENLKTQVSTLTAENEELKKNTVEESEVEARVRAQLEAEYTVKNHKVEILAQHKDDLLVPELVMGDTVEALDASLEQALKRSEEIRAKIGGTKEKKTTTTTTRTAKSPSAGGDSIGNYSAEYIASLDPRSEEYKEFRKKLGLR